MQTRSAEILGVRSLTLDELPESGRIVIAQRPGVSESLQKRVRPAGLVALKPALRKSAPTLLVGKPDVPERL